MKPNASDPQFIPNRRAGKPDPNWRIGGYCPREEFDPLPPDDAYKDWDYIGTTNYKDQLIRWYARPRTEEEQ